MKNVITNISTLSVGLGLVLVAGTFIFGAAPMSILAWFTFIFLGIGGLGLFGTSVANFFEKKDEDKKVTAKKDEKDEKKPQEPAPKAAKGK